MTPDGKQLLVCASDDDTVQVFDLRGVRARRHAALRSRPGISGIAPAGDRVYVANEDDNLVTAIDLEKRAMITEIPVGVEPEGMGISPGRQGDRQHL